HAWTIFAPTALVAALLLFSYTVRQGREGWLNALATKPLSWWVMTWFIAVASVVFLGVLAISPFKDFRREWKQYKRSYLRFAQTRADTKKLLADYRPDIDQIWLPGMNVVDRCTTCHQG